MGNCLHVDRLTFMVSKASEREHPMKRLKGFILLDLARGIIAIDLVRCLTSLTRDYVTSSLF